MEKMKKSESTIKKKIREIEIKRDDPLQTLDWHWWYGGYVEGLKWVIGKE